MKQAPRYSEFIGLKLPAELADDLKRHAALDDRSVSSLVRRLIVAGLKRPPQADENDAQERNDERD